MDEAVYCEVWVSGSSGADCCCVVVGEKHALQVAPNNAQLHYMAAQEMDDIHVGRCFVDVISWLLSLF